MSEVLDKIKSRRSVKRYKAEMPPKEVIDAVIEAGVYSATGKNRQSPIIIAVTNKEVRDRISKANCQIGGWHEGFDPFYGAPVILVVLANKDVDTHIYDGSLVIGNLMLAAHDQGLGSCWIHRARQEFEMPEWKEWLKSLGIEGDYEGIGHVALGYADGDYPKVSPRKDNWVYYVE